MTETIKTGDFIEMDYVGRVKGSNQIFDLTLADVAKKEGILQQDHAYKPLMICVGKGHLVAGVDKFLDGKEIGKEYTFEVLPEEAFGKRNPKLIQLAPTSFFEKKKINPIPGLQLAVDNALATVRSVSSGRVILDFNHPLAGRTLAYWVKVTRKVTKEDEKIKGIVELLLGLDPKITIGEKEDTIEVKGKLGEKIIERVIKQIKELVPEASKKEVKFVPNTPAEAKK